jgi:AcrR family transcriptional regulator
MLSAVQLGTLLSMTERSLWEQRRERRRAHSRHQILDAAEEVFARNGFHEASLREIAELAEYSVGAVYGFFAGKNELYREIFLRRAVVCLPGMREILSSAQPPRRQLLDLAEWQVNFFRDHPSSTAWCCAADRSPRRRPTRPTTTASWPTSGCRRRCRRSCS